jgi:hypothetical protein
LTRLAAAGLPDGRRRDEEQACQLRTKNAAQEVTGGAIVAVRRAKKPDGLKEYRIVRNIFIAREGAFKHIVFRTIH